ncbi:MAG TPA: hypothetical protein VJJ53_03180 [Candidatus Nanoarchaeia archaeon]|nr:hypothetical protein [Candidatus Nanoarchaeia archaeon]
MKEKSFNLEKEYEDLKKKYKLPDFKRLNREFDLEEIEHDGFLLKRIRNRLYEKVSFFIKILESILYPSSSDVASLYESKFFTEEDMDNVSSLFKKLMLIDRHYLLVDIEEDEDKDSEFINTVYEDWLILKKDLIKFLDIMKESWKKEDKIPTEKDYFG